MHRRVITQALTSEKRLASGHQELRRDRGFSSANHLYRVYLDNYGELADNPGAKGRGSGGTAAPKGDKVLKYARLACELLVRGRASQKELHIVGGGFVYIAMFRRPLLADLNALWRRIIELGEVSHHRREDLGEAVELELVRFIALTPLAVIDFRTAISENVTASDASTSGASVSARSCLPMVWQQRKLSAGRHYLPR